MKINNPYLDELAKIPICRYNCGYQTNNFYEKDYPKVGYKDYRGELTRKYSWAIPSRDILDTIAQFAPEGIVEIGAGTGYWAYLLTQLGINAVCYDSAPPLTGNNPYNHKNEWHEINFGGPSKLLNHQDRVLMLCWPPYNDPMAEDCLALYTGKKIIYIGESSYGCTGTDKFHDILDEKWESERFDMQQWDGLYDNLYLLRRK